MSSPQQHQEAPNPETPPQTTQQRQPKPPLEAQQSAPARLRSGVLAVSAALARAAALTPDRRLEIAYKAAAARWGHSPRVRKTLLEAQLAKVTIAELLRLRRAPQLRALHLDGCRCETPEIHELVAAASGHLCQALPYGQPCPNRAGHIKGLRFSAAKVRALKYAFATEPTGPRDAWARASAARLKAKLAGAIYVCKEHAVRKTARYGPRRPA